MLVCVASRCRSFLEVSLTNRRLKEVENLMVAASHCHAALISLFSVAQVREAVEGAREDVALQTQAGRHGREHAAENQQAASDVDTES